MGLIKKYDTGELIGAGSMGSVYRARDIVLERDVALKILHTGPDLDSELKERFYREARTAAKLKHPNIVTLYELDEFNGIPFMAMELLTGADLRQYIKERRPLSLAQKVEFVAQVCDGLAEAHRYGIVHRDIKPSNIYLHEERTAKVLDFGIARLPSSKLTISGRVLGTPNYMSPEQITRRPCDARSDLFSAGIVFYEFLVYAHPFQSTFIPRRIADDEPDSLYDHDPLIPKSLSDLLYKALQKMPEDRIQTAAQFAGGLRSVLHELRSGFAGGREGTEAQMPTGEAATNPDQDPGSPSGRVAAFVELLAGFDKAVDLADITSAQASVEQMVRLEAVDDRFSEALRDCREKLESLRGGAPPAAGAEPGHHVVPPPGAPQTIPPVTGNPWDDTQRFGKGSEPPLQPVQPDEIRNGNGPGQPACPFCGTANRGEAAFCRECGKSLSGQANNNDRGPSVTEGPRWDTLATLRDRLRKVIRPMRTRIASYFTVVRRTVARLPHLTDLSLRQKIAAAAVAPAVLIGALALVVVLRPKIPLQERGVGTAFVRFNGTNLLKEQQPNSKRIMTLRAGTKVNLLKRVTAGDVFVRVQFASPETVSPPGYVRRTNLDRWDSDDATVSWDFVQFHRPKAGASEQEQRTFAEELRLFANRFQGATEACDADLERTGLYLRLAETRKNQGKPRSEWDEDLEQARKALGPSDCSPEAGELRQHIEELGAADASVETIGPSDEELQRKRQLQSLNSRIEGLYYQGEWEQLPGLVNEMLRIDPTDHQAKWWQSLIQKDNKTLYKRQTNVGGRK